MQTGLIWTEQTPWYKRNTLFGGQEVTVHSLCSPDFLLSLDPVRVSVHSVTHLQVRCICSDSVCLRFIPLLCSPLSHLCHCLVIAFSSLFCTWCDFLPSTVTSITWEIHWITACEKHTSKWNSSASTKWHQDTGLGGAGAEDKLLQVCSRATWVLISSYCLCWSEGLKWQKGSTRDTRKCFLGTGMLQK